MMSCLAPVRSPACQCQCTCQGRQVDSEDSEDSEESVDSVVGKKTYFENIVDRLQPYFCTAERNKNKQEAGGNTGNTGIWYIYGAWGDKGLMLDKE